MKLLEVITQPDHPILRSQTEPVTLEQLFTRKVQEVIDAMEFYVKHHKGAASLAANQAGYNLRIIVVDTGGVLRNLTAFVNPEIVWASRTLINGWEECLSLPGRRFQVPRPDTIVFRTQDRRGIWIKDRLSGFPARLFQHEADHLNGILINQRAVQPWLQVVDRDAHGVGIHRRIPNS